MNAITAWSFSRWEQFTLCPAQFKYQHIDKLHTEDKAFFKKGRDAHKHVENVIYGAPLDENIIEKERGLVRELVDLKPAIMETEKQWGFTPSWGQTTWFAAWLRVIIDVFVSYGDGTGEVLDWKTGKKRDEGAYQMNLMATAVFHRHPYINHLTTRLVYIEKGGQEIAEHYRENLPSYTSYWNAEAAKIMAEKEFAPRPNFKCQWCDFRRSNNGPCRYG